MAAFNFPNSPSVNDTYTANGVTFTWNGTIWQRTSASVGAQGGTGAQGSQGSQGTAAGLTIGTSAPGSPSAGDMWWDSDSGLFLTYYNDGNSSQWVELNQGPIGAQGAQGHQGAAGAQGSDASISNNANNRLITGGSGTNLNAEANLTYNGSNLALSGNDNQYITIGASADLTLKADGSNSAIVHSGDGDFAILAQGANENIKIGSTGYLTFQSGGNTERLRITSAGHSYHGGSVGIQTNNIDGANISNPVGAGHSLVGLYIGDGSLLFSSALSRSGGYYISTDINALNAGPVTLNSEMKLDGTWVIV